MMAAVRSEFGRAGVAGEGTAGSVGTTTAEKREGNGYGLVALATVVFDIDSGQRLDSLHPTNCGLTDDAKKSIAHLALPHSNNQDEGDTQFLARFRNHPEDLAFLYGFVLFRQQKDQSRSRGYFQKALVLISEQPFVDLYDRILRVIGPLYFKFGADVLAAIFSNIQEWPPIVYDAPVALPLAGTYISCIIPQLLTYKQIDQDTEDDDASYASPANLHFITEGEDASGDEDDGDEASEESVLFKEGRFVVTKHVNPPSPSFGDLMLAKRTHQTTAFENVGLYSSFIGLENSLWLLWQLAITGESLLILSPHARTCSQAILAFTSLIAPLQFQGDYRPYFTIYEADFDEIARRQQGGVSRPDTMTILGTTNPFFMKSLKHWPNALVFQFLESSTTASESGSTPATDSNKTGCISVRIKKKDDLDSFEPSHKAMFLRRCSRYVIPDATVLRQLVAPAEVAVTQTANLEEEPYATINNAILRQHFRKLTKEFLRPFEEYFGIWKSNGIRSNLYMCTEEFMKPFNEQAFLASINPKKLPRQIKPSKWKALYLGFIRSPHFEPWFAYRRQRCIHHFANTLRSVREGVDSGMLLKAPYGEAIPVDQCEELQKEIEVALDAEKSRLDADQKLIETMEGHLSAVKQRLGDASE